MDCIKNQLIQLPTLILEVLPPFAIKKVVEGTFHRFFRSTSTWESFDRAMKVNRKQWSDKQYPDHWSFRVSSRSLKKIIGESINNRSRVDNQISSTSTNKLPPMLIIQYRGNHTKNFVRKVRNIAAAQILLTTRKIKTC